MVLMMVIIQQAFIAYSKRKVQVLLVVYRIHLLKQILLKFNYKMIWAHMQLEIYVILKQYHIYSEFNNHKIRFGN